jgi:hypothetical protein
VLAFLLDQHPTRVTVDELPFDLDAKDFAEKGPPEAATDVPTLIPSRISVMRARNCRLASSSSHARSGRFQSNHALENSETRNPAEVTRAARSTSFPTLISKRLRTAAATAPPRLALTASRTLRCISSERALHAK